MADQVADLVSEAREFRMELERQVRQCEAARREQPGAPGVPILYFYPSLFNGTVYIFDNSPVFRDRGTGSGLGPGFQQIPFAR